MGWYGVESAIIGQWDVSFLLFLGNLLQFHIVVLSLRLRRDSLKFWFSSTLVFVTY